MTRAADCISVKALVSKEPIGTAIVSFAPLSKSWYAAPELLFVLLPLYVPAKQGYVQLKVATLNCAGIVKSTPVMSEVHGCSAPQQQRSQSPLSSEQPKLALCAAANASTL